MSSEISRLPAKAGWQYIREWDMVVGVCPKCGSGSIRAAIDAEGLEYWHRADPMEVSRRVFVVRHPLDRFESLWRNKCRDGGLVRVGKKIAPGTFHQLDGLTPRELFEYSLKNPNHHWTPQIVLHGQVAQRECRIVRIEDMNTFWHKLPDSTHPFPQHNRTHGKVEYDMELMDEVLNYYEDDYILWAQADPRRG